MSARSTKLTPAFTIAELLIALVITGMLLAAVAAAFNASIMNYRENEDTFKVINSTRQALSRITSQLRDANSVDPCSPENECAFWTADDEDNLIYRYDSNDSKLYLIDNISDSNYVLCDNITAMTFTREVVFEEDELKVKSIQISMTVQAGQVQQTLSAAAAIRRNLH